MLFTLEQARQDLARFVGSGSCDTATIDARINEAIARLADSVASDRLRKLMRVTVVGGTVTLPSNVETVLWANTDTVPARIFGRPYEFLSSGLGDLDSRNVSSGFKDLVDRGDGWPTMYDVPVSDNDQYLHLYYEDSGDSADTVGVVYTDASSKTNRVQLSTEAWPVSGVPALSGTLDELQDESPAVTPTVRVDQVVKPETSGHLYLLSVDPSTGSYKMLARYAPTETIPQFRRYELTSTSSDWETCILMLVRMRIMPLLHDDDIVPIDSMQALKLMMMAIRDENAGKLETAGAFEGKAIYLLSNRASANKMTNGTPVVMNVDYRTSLGRALNRGVL